LTTDKFIGPQFFIRQFFREEKERAVLDSFYHIVRRYNAETMEHSKIFVIDDLCAVSGSANLTEPGMWENYETVSVAETKEEVQAIKATFDKAWQEALISD